jgi:hypothetical protein
VICIAAVVMFWSEKQPKKTDPKRPSSSNLSN